MQNSFIFLKILTQIILSFFSPAPSQWVKYLPILSLENILEKQEIKTLLSAVFMVTSCYRVIDTIKIIFKEHLNILILSKLFSKNTWIYWYYQNYFQRTLEYIDTIKIIFKEHFFQL